MMYLGRVERVELSEQADAQIGRPGHLPGIGLVEPRQQREQRRFPCPVRADDADAFAGCDPERHVVEDGPAPNPLPRRSTLTSCLGAAIARIVRERIRRSGE